MQARGARGFLGSAAARKPRSQRIGCGTCWRSATCQLGPPIPFLAGEMSRAHLGVSDAAPTSGGRFAVASRRCDSVRAASRVFDAAVARHAASCWLLCTIRC
jgi:hypothetical protein